MRGSLGSLLQFFDCIGYLIENIGGSYVSYENLSLLSALVALFSFLLFVWVPESPYYLQNRGREAEALRALRFFRDNVDCSELESEIEEMKVSLSNSVCFLLPDEFIASYIYQDVSDVYFSTITMP